MSKSIQVFKTAAIKVTYDPDVCIHSADCVRGLPAVFDPGRRRWVRLDNATAEEVAAVIKRCPSGALQYAMQEVIEPTPGVGDLAPETAVDPVARPGRTTPAPPVSVTVSDAGPLSVRGHIVLTGADGRVLFTGDRALLCRCGQTKRAPFCDGSHKLVPPPTPLSAS